MKKTKLKNLFWLILFFLLFGTQFFLGLFNLTIPYAIISELGLISLLIFIKITFYKDLKIIFPLLLILFIILKSINTILRFLFNFKAPPTKSLSQFEIPFYYYFVWTISIQIIICFSLLSFSEISTYLRIKSYNIEPWVKYRYLILGISSFVFILDGLILPFSPIEGGYDNLILVIIMAFFIITFSIGNLVGWVMPTRLKNYFNRNFNQTSDDEISETELLNKIKHQLTGE